MGKRGWCAIVLAVLASQFLFAGRAVAWTVGRPGEARGADAVGDPRLAIPQVLAPCQRRANAPHFDGDGPDWATAAVFWFGRVTPAENYADVRVGYADDALYLRVSAFDRRLWYDTSPSPEDLTAWDAVSLYLDLDGNLGEAPDASSFRLVAQLDWWEPRDAYQAAYQGGGSGWLTASFPYTTTTVWRGNAPNDSTDDDGWIATFVVPFASLGLSAAPSPGSTWGLAVVLHDRDDAAGSPIPDQAWPEAMDGDRPATWGQLGFGLPAYTPPPGLPGGTVTVRHGLGSAIVRDAAVGGGTTCGEGLDPWTQWGQANYAGYTELNIQNQADVADWPCFSKYYVTFPLDAVPPGSVIVSATLTLHQFGNSGGGQWGEPPPSFIQALTVAEGWEEASLTWNNAPLAVENVAMMRVDPLSAMPPWPGVPREWDVSRATAGAYASGGPLRLALYSADCAYHTGKYFVTSDVPDWNAAGRPTLTVTWGRPLALLHKIVRPTTSAAFQVVSYTLAVVGNGLALTLTDELPAQVSAPGPILVSGGPPPVYDPIARRLTWTGTLTQDDSVTITFPVTVLVSGPLAVASTAVLTDAEGGVVTDAATFIIDAWHLSLPLVWRDWRR